MEAYGGGIGGKVQAVLFGSAVELQQGCQVAAVGSPFGLLSPTHFFNRWGWNEVRKEGRNTLPHFCHVLPHSVTSYQISTTTTTFHNIPHIPTFSHTSPHFAMFCHTQFNISIYVLLLPPITSSPLHLSSAWHQGWCPTRGRQVAPPHPYS